MVSNVTATAKLSAIALLWPRTAHEAFSRRSLNTLETLAIGAVSGLSAQSSCHPLDVIRKRLQLQGLGDRPVLYKNVFQAATGIFRDQGFKGLYKGDAFAIYHNRQASPLPAWPRSRRRAPATWSTRPQKTCSASARPSFASPFRGN